MTKTPSGKSVTDTTNSTSNSNANSREFYVCYLDKKVVRGLNFDESYELFTEALDSDNPCCVFRDHEELRVP